MATAESLISLQTCVHLNPDLFFYGNFFRFGFPPAALSKCGLFLQLFLPDPEHGSGVCGHCQKCLHLFEKSDAVSGKPAMA